jgi:hypothetical protein
VYDFEYKRVGITYVDGLSININLVQNIIIACLYYMYKRTVRDDGDGRQGRRRNVIRQI